MATITYESMESIIPNATMRKRLTDGVVRQYLVKPNTGYVMHDVGYDSFREVPVLDDDGNPIYDEYDMPVVDYMPILGYRTTEASVGYNYDFTTSEMQDDEGNIVTAYGSRQFFCRLREGLPEDQIYGVTTPQQPEIM